MRSRSNPTSWRSAISNASNSCVPARIERQLVVGERIRALLRLAPARRHHHGDLLDAKLARTQHAAMPGNDGAVLCHQDRIGPAPFTDRCRDLVDLLVAVRADVARVGNETFDRPALHLVRRPALHDLVPVDLPARRERDHVFISRNHVFSSRRVALSRNSCIHDDPGDAGDRGLTVVEMSGLLGESK